jgi:hypothetical protein
MIEFRDYQKRIITEGAKNLSLKSLPNEIWKPIKDYEDLYHISSYGRVKSLNKEQLLSASGGVRIRKEKILSQQKDDKGYLSLKVCKNNCSKRFKIHRLVAIAFIENPLNKNQVNHIDGVKSNNVVSNLEWCTNSENQIHACIKGLKKTKLSKKEVINIRKDERSLLEIGNEYGVSFQTISEIKNRKTWKHV